jgi:hypothetical protein
MPNIDDLGFPKGEGRKWFIGSADCPVPPKNLWVKH